MRTKLKALLNSINVEYKKAEKIYKDAKNSAQEIAASASASPSQSGDRFHAQGTADLAKQKFEFISLFKKEIEESLDLDIPDKVAAPCYIKLKSSEIYLVNNPVLISGLKIVSSDAPLGSSLLGEKIGEEEIIEIG